MAKPVPFQFVKTSRAWNASRVSTAVSADGRPVARTMGRSRWTLLGGVGLGLALGSLAGCVVQDPLYCSDSNQCPTVETATGSVKQSCHPLRHICVGGTGDGGTDACFEDKNCSGDPAHSKCELMTGACVACDPADNATSNSCANVTDAKICATVGGVNKCVGCLTNLDCPFAKPICDNNQCRPCGAHKDCEGEVKCGNDLTVCTDSLVCVRDGDLDGVPAGSCAQNGSGEKGRVLYVNKQAANCSDTDPAFGTTFDKPLCEASRAWDLARAQVNRRYVRMVGTSPYYPIGQPLTELSLSFIGAPTKNYMTPAIIEGRGVLFNVSGTANITIDQLQLSQQNQNNMLVSCTGTMTKSPTVRVWQSQLMGNTPISFSGTQVAAVDVYNCNLHLSGNMIGANSQAKLTDALATAHTMGINIVDTMGGGQTSYLIENNVIAGNVGTAISLLGASNGTPKISLRFNTIIGNGRNSVKYDGGVRCPFGGMLQEFSSSIVVGNTPDGNGTQMRDGDSCSPKNVVLGTSDTNRTKPWAIPLLPMLDDLFRLPDNAANRACCIDKVSPASGETLPATDIDGRARPLPTNGKWDIGASELKQ